MDDIEVFDFVERCENYLSPAAILEDLLRSVKTLGFEHLILSGVPTAGQKLAPLVELNGWPPGWFERYTQANHAAVDGVCLYSALAHKPFLWAEVPAHLALTKNSIRVAGEAAEFGIRSGFAVPMHGSQRWQTVLSFASPAQRCELSERDKQRLMTVSIFAAMAVQDLVDVQDAAIFLTEREKEVLLWVAGGKSAWETSQILGISERTVKKHQDVARQKFGVGTTVQAVVQAIRRRYIRP